MRLFLPFINSSCLKGYKITPFSHKFITFTYKCQTDLIVHIKIQSEPHFIRKYIFFLVGKMMPSWCKVYGLTERELHAFIQVNNHQLIFCLVKCGVPRSIIFPLRTGNIIKSHLSVWKCPISSLKNIDYLHTTKKLKNFSFFFFFFL